MIVGFLGTGRIAAPMARVLAGAGHEVLVSERGRDVSAELAAHFTTISVRDNQGVVDGSDVVVVCLLAAAARQELPALRFRADHKVISVMAEISLAEIAGMIGGTRELCVTIPMPFIDSGGCPLPVYPASGTLVELFGADNAVMPMDSEAAMKPHFAATAVMSTLLQELIIVRDWLGAHAGGRVAAEQYVALLASGYLNALPKDGAKRLDEALNDLATAGGLNAQLLRHMRDSGTMEALEQGLDDLFNR